MADCDKCPIEARFEQLLSDLEKEKSHASETRKDIYERLRKLETETGRTDERYKNIERELSDLKEQQKQILARIDKITEQPAKRWDSAVTSTVSAGIGGIIGFVVTKVFGG